MSNALYNKMKTLDNTRKDLKNLLDNKGVDTTGVEAFSSLVGMVGQLSKPTYNINDDEIWEGITRKDAPTNYYKGDDDWRGVIDLHAIMAADTYTSGVNKSIWLIRVSDNPSDSIKLSAQEGPGVDTLDMWGFQYCKFSDSDSVTSITTSSSGMTHTWDTSKDIIAENGERFRYIICYGTSSYKSVRYASTKISFDAVLAYSGSFNYLSLFGDGSSTNSSMSYHAFTTISTPKYIEITSDCTITYLRFMNYQETTKIAPSRLKTLIINGKPNYLYGNILGSDLEYLVYNNTTALSFNIYGVQNENISTYIYLKNVNSLSMQYCNNADVYVDGISSLTSFGNDENLRLSIHSTSSTSIGSDAFGDSTNIGVQLHLEDIGAAVNRAFLNFGNNDNKLKIGTINGQIYDLAFFNSGLNQDIIVGNGCAAIGNGAFGNCNIRHIDLSNSSITELPSSHNYYTPAASNESSSISGAFRNCFSVESISLPKSLKTINDYAFNGCYNVKQIILPIGVTTIKSYAFKNCYSLEEITLPSTITSLGTGIFTNCKALKSATTPNSITSLPERLFLNCSNLENVSLADNTSALGSGCFSGCTSLTRITLPKNIISIPSRCFNGCVSLTSVTCSEGVIQSIYDYAFADCAELEEIFDTSNVVTTGIGIFMNCKKLVIFVPTNITSANANMLAANNSKLNFSNTTSISTTILLRGSNWSLDNVLYFLQNLRDNTGGTKNTLTMGVPYSRIAWATNSSVGTYSINTDTSYTKYETSVYSSYSSKYVLETEDGLEWSDSSTEGAITVANYVASKNWSIS